MTLEEEVKNGIEFLKKNFEQFKSEESGSFFKIKDKTILISFVEVEFENEDGEFEEYGEDIEISKEEFIKSINELKSSSFNESNTILNTVSSSYHIIDSEIFDFYKTTSNLIELKTLEESDKKYNLNIVRNNLTLVLNIQKFAKTSEVLSVFSYGAIKIDYHHHKNKLSEEEESKVVDLLIFELFSRDKFYIDKNYIWHFDEDFDEEEDSAENSYKKLDKIEIRSLEEYNYGISLFLSALQVYDAELKMLSLYKVIEYFGPIVVKLEGNELLRKKLDSRKIYNPDGEFLNSIFDLVNSTETRKRDKEIPKAILLNAVDFIEVIKFLPESIINQINGNNLNYDSKKQDIDRARNLLADLLYATRNKVAHAKSNFSSTGIECSLENLPKLNEFLVELCQRTIRWYNRLPKHQKQNNSD